MPYNMITCRQLGLIPEECTTNATVHVCCQLHKSAEVQWLLNDFQ